MKTRKMSTISVGVKVDGKTNVKLQDIKDIEESSSCSEIVAEDSLAYRYRKLEDSHLIGEYVRDFDPMLHRVSLIH